MKLLRFILIAICLWALPIGKVGAETFQLNNGQTLSGDVVSFDESGLIVRLADDRYSDRTPWAQFSQADLRKLSENPKIAPFVEQFIEESASDRQKRTEVTINTDFQRLKRPEAHSLLGALFSSSIGVFVLLLLYIANLYAAYEISIFRARPAGMVCGISAVAPFVGPIVFLCLPTQSEQFEDVDAPPQAPAVIRPFASAGSAMAAGAAAPTASVAPSAPGEGGKATSELPKTQVYQRGAFTFNRRFFETKFPGFFGVVRRDADKDMVLVIRSARGHFIAQRISRIAQNELHVHVQKGPASEEVMIPFSEIQEVQLKHAEA